jgi:hypothetical protein
MDSKKYKIVNNLIMNAGLAIVIAFTAQILATGTIVIKILLINMLLVYVVACIVGMGLPIGKIGESFANKFNFPVY